MREEETARFIAKKAYEVSYALCRVAARIQSPLAPRLEGCAFQIIEAASALGVAGIRSSLELAKSYVRIGADVNIIHKSNADLLLGEIMRFDSSLAEMENVSFPSKANLSGIFSSTPFPSEKKKIDSEKDIPAIHILSEAEHQSAKNRQSAILLFISKSGNCRMRDLLENFPAASERTLRYDLQGLVEQGAVERVGEGGPGTYYRAKAAIPLPGASNL